MNDVRDYLARELPLVNACIARQIEALPRLVSPVAAHVLLAGGKRLRPMLTILCARSFGYRGDDLYPLAASMEFLHSATLIHDDILDGAELRRGKPAAHLVFDQTSTILAGDVLLALANQLVAGYGVPRLVSILSEAVMRTVVGEVAEIASVREPSLSRAEYMQIITGKTAYLIQAACRAGAVLAGAPAEAEELAADLGMNLGIAFQLVDDALDYTSPSEVSGKPAGGDLREGKLTLPLILFLEDLPKAERSAIELRIKAGDLAEAEIADLVGRIRESGAAERTRQVAAESLARAHAALAGFPDCPERSVLAQSLDYTLTRRK